MSQMHPVRPSVRSTMTFLSGLVLATGFHLAYCSMVPIIGFWGAFSLNTVMHLLLPGLFAPAMVSAWLLVAEKPTFKAAVVVALSAGLVHALALAAWVSTWNDPIAQTYSIAFYPQVLTGVLIALVSYRFSERFAKRHP